MHTLKFNFEFVPTLTVDKKLLKEKNGKLLVDIQGKLEICINNKRFFLEPSLAILELGVHLARWKRDIDDTQKDFYYFTMEHDERDGPILALVNKRDNKWSLFSIWQEYEHKESLPINVITVAVDLFLTHLNKELIKNFGINIGDFTNSY
ncbi:hypothetical protein [Psychrobacillus psychrodurans]|uniref:DUF7878 domain-containing protein n=1 Tax=Psychrobacillus psychrodurans TaxID=126157 RepID=UPI003D02F749